jgi:hypothetical protein
LGGLGYEKKGVTEWRNVRKKMNNDIEMIVVLDVVKSNVPWDVSNS